MPLQAVPYAMWAEKALTVSNDSIGSEQIKNGSIKAEDLDPGFSFANVSGSIDINQVPATISRAADLKSHIDSPSAHAASAITVRQNFATFNAGNVQEALEKIDSKLTDEVVNRQGGQGDLNTTTTTLQTNLDTETANRAAAVASEVATRASADTAEAAARTAADTAETTARTAADTSLQSSVNTAQSTADTAVANAATAQGTANTAVTNAAAAQSTAGTAVSNAAAAQSTANSAVSAVAAAQSTANTAVSNAAAAQSTADSKVSRSGDTMTGNLNMGGNDVYNIGSTGYSAVGSFNSLFNSVANLNTTVSGHESRITALEGRAIPTDLSQLGGQVNTSQVPQYMRPAALR